MNLLGAVRSRLGWKIFLSYLIVIVVGVVVLAMAAELAVPSSCTRYWAGRASMRGQAGMGLGGEMALFAGFRAAVSESLFLAAIAATLAAVVLSLLVSRRVVEPVRGA